jgi:type IV pilus assembly protein PilW
MRNYLTAPALGSRRAQAGMTLIEFMVSIVIGMLMIAALATLIANQSTTRGEVDRSGKMIENGRYSIQAMASDIQMAGYWGELSTLAAAGAEPDPCSLAVATIEAAMPFHIQGYNNPDPLTLGCVTNHKPGTDVLVVRRVDPDMTDMMTAGVIVPTKAKAGQIYLQTGLSGLTFMPIFKAADGTTDATTFNLKRKDGTPAHMRKFVLNIYYISTCSICSGTPDTVPTLKRVELGVTAGAPAFQAPTTIAEGIENLQIDYGVDTVGNGTPTGADVNIAAGAAWADVMPLKNNRLARSLYTTPGYVDSKSYTLGTTGGVVAPAVPPDGYKRHAFTQSVRIMNPGSKRAL